MAVTWYLEPIGQAANENIAKWLEGDVTEAEKHGADTTEGKRDLYAVPYEKVLQVLAGTSFFFRIYRSIRKGAKPKPVNALELLRDAANKGYFIPAMRREFEDTSPRE